MEQVSTSPEGAETNDRKEDGGSKSHTVVCTGSPEILKRARSITGHEERERAMLLKTRRLSGGRAGSPNIDATVRSMGHDSDKIRDSPTNLFSLDSDENSPLLEHTEKGSNSLQAKKETFLHEFLEIIFDPVYELGRMLYNLAEMSGIPLVSKLFWQILSVLQWCFFNVVLILLNDRIFQTYGFAFPITLTAIHFGMSYFGAFVIIEVLRVQPKAEIESKDVMTWVLPLASVTCFNVVLGQISLRYLPLPILHSVKALAPLFTVLMQLGFFQKALDVKVYLSLVPIVAGAVLAYLPAMEFLLPAFLWALFSVALGSATVVLAEALLQGKHHTLDSINALYHMVPYSAIILVLPALFFEGSSVYTWYTTQIDSAPAMLAILISGCFAFCLNFALFYTIQSTSALTFNVAGNLKIVITLMFTWLLFQAKVAELSVIGCGLEWLGVVLYGWALYEVRRQKVQSPSSDLTNLEDFQNEQEESVEMYLGAML